MVLWKKYLISTLDLLIVHRHAILPKLANNDRQIRLNECPIRFTISVA